MKKKKKGSSRGGVVVKKNNTRPVRWFQWIKTHNAKMMWVQSQGPIWWKEENWFKEVVLTSICMPTHTYTQTHTHARAKTTYFQKDAEKKISPRGIPLKSNIFKAIISNGQGVKREFKSYHITSTQLNYEHCNCRVIIWFLEDTFKS